MICRLVVCLSVRFHFRFLKYVILPVCTLLSISVFGKRYLFIYICLELISERLVMRKHLLPVIPNENLRDQFAYKLSGSTTSALVSLTDTVGRLLEVNKYVRCIMIDFPKAFDTVNHEILLSKMQKFPIPANILKWIIK